MNSKSIWHWIIAPAALSTVVPAAKALSRVGLSPWWAILSFVPVVGWFSYGLRFHLLRVARFSRA